MKVDSLDHQIATGNLPKPYFIKIDVQGVELDVLLRMSKTTQKHKPKLLVEIHAIDIHWKTGNLQRVLEFLIANGYSIYHIESEKTVNYSNAQIVNQDEHLYCF